MNIFDFFFAHLQFIHFIVNKTINTNGRDNHSDNQKYSNLVLILNSVIKVLHYTKTANYIICSNFLSIM